MALVTSLIPLLVVAVLLAVATAFGLRLLRALDLQPESRLEGFLYAAALSFSALQVAIFLLGMTFGLKRLFLLTLLAAMALAAGKDWRRTAQTFRALRSFVRRVRQTRGLLLLAAAIAAVLLLDALLTLAPLTGSDALHYHFTAPSYDVGRRFTPHFDLAQSFLTGQNHLLLLAGLTLGNDQTALGLIFLGGLLAAGALFQLARQMMSAGWALTVVLVFLLTPLVFWQMTVAGAPDIWMAFYTTLAVLAAGRGAASQQLRWLVLAGWLAGAAAGAKYTGWAIPVILCLLILYEARSLRAALLAGLASLAAGIYPLLRNFLWTGDPFFPFLMTRLAPASVNPYLLESWAADTGAATARESVLSMLTYPFVVVLEGTSHGVGHYLGPLILAFAPLLLLALRNTPLTRLAALLCLGVFLSNTFSSQQGRFLLPVLPLALALVFAGAARLRGKSFALARSGSRATLGFFFLFAAGSYSLFAKDFLPVVLGREVRQDFLLRMAPDYRTAEFVNRQMAGRAGSVMVFFRHVYYLRVPYVPADPEKSWRMDPARYRTPEQLLDLLRQRGVGWVLKSPAYPESFAPLFEQLEAQGRLRPVASGEIELVHGWRIEGVRQPARAVLLEVVAE